MAAGASTVVGEALGAIAITTTTEQNPVDAAGA